MDAVLYAIKDFLFDGALYAFQFSLLKTSGFLSANTFLTFANSLERLSRKDKNL